MHQPRISPSPPRCRFWVESLESRICLAGDVTANIINGDLIITGDAADNHITIGVDDNSLSILGGQGTVVSGNVLSLDFTGDNIRIRLRGGADSICFDLAVNRPVDVLIDAGGGDDTVYTWNRSTPARYDVRLGGGDDQLDLDVDADSIRVNAGAGDDQLEVVGGSYGGQGEITIGHIDVRAGGGDDVLLLDEGTVNTAFVTMGGGEDAFIVYGFDATGNMTVNLAGGADEVFVNGLQGDSFDLTTGAGGDLLHFDARLTGDLTINTGGGDDALTIEHTQLQNSSANATVNLGGGNDALSINQLTLERAATFILGGGNDTAMMIGSTSVNTTLLMGSGRDLLLFGGTCGTVVADGGGGLDQLGGGLQCLGVQFSHSNFETLTGPF